MFKRDRNIDNVKKAQGKVLDAKRDSFNRLKHIRTFLEHVENHEAKEFFQSNYSVVYFIFHDAFSIVEGNIRSRGVHKSQREEFENVRYLFEKILVLLPELIAKGWQAHSIRIVMKKLLHHGNSHKTICEAIRLFIIWYQILREAAPAEVDIMFATLIPNLIPGPLQRPRSPPPEGAHPAKDYTFYTTLENEIGPVVAGEQSHLFPPVPGDIQPEDQSAALLEFMLQVMVTQVTKIQWDQIIVNGVRQYERCFSFLLDKFRAIYIPHLFPNMSVKYSLYQPNLDLPAAVRSDSVLLSKHQSLVVQFLVQYVNPQKGEREAGATRNAQRMENPWTYYAARSAWSSFMDDDMLKSVPVLPDTDFLSVYHRAVVRNVLYATPANVDFVHEIFRQCFVSPLGQTQTTKKVIAVYREWIHMNLPDPPSFLIEQPSSEQPRNPVFCGQQNLYKVFITNASNFFLLSLPVSEEKLLEEQVDLCKRVINIYRFMVMKKLMERATWEQLLYVILHVTSQVLSNDVPRKSGDSLGRQLAPPLFQTLIVTWIKANLHATICVDLWNGFVRVLSTLSHWEPLIDEWAKTMKTLTRILTTRVYGLDLDNLPLARLSEQQTKRRRNLKGNVRGISEGTPQIRTPQSRQQQSSTDIDGKTEKSSPDLLAQSSSLYTGQLQRRLSDSHLHTYRQLRFRSKQPTRSWSYPSVKNLGCPLHQESTNTSPAASSTALESSSMKDHQLNQMMDCTSSENAAIPMHLTQEVFIRTGSNASEFGEHRASVSSRFDLVRCDSQGESALRESHHMLAFEEANTATNNNQNKCEGKSADDSVADDSKENKDADDEFLGETPDPDGRSVLAGGSQKGWCPEVAVVLWRRMVCSLGNVNNIRDPAIHAKVMEQVADLCETLIKVRENQGVSEDNLSSPTPPQFIPPIHMLTPWFFEATMLSDEYEKGKLIAYQLLCDLSFRTHDIPLSAEYVTRLYDVMHRGLTSDNQKVKNCIIKASGTRFLGTTLPGFSLLIMDFVQASGEILDQQTLKAMPRAEAVMTLGAHLFIGTIYGDLQTLDSTYHQGHRLVNLKNLETAVMDKLLLAAKGDPDWQARCTAISAVAVYCYQQLVYRSKHAHFLPALRVLVQSLKPSPQAPNQKGVKFSKCNQYTVCQTAAECLSLLAEFVDDMIRDLPDIPEIIVKSVAAVLGEIYPPKNPNQELNESFSNLIISLMFCLAEWSMKIPLDELTKSKPSSLHSTLSALDSIIKGVKSESSMDSTGALLDKIFSSQKISKAKSALESPIEIQRSLHAPLTTSFSDPQHQEAKYAGEQKATSAIKLAAKAILCHLMNNIGHFPMNSVGLTNPSSLTIENDDVPGLSEAPEISKQTFNAPNIQFFAVNDSSIVSLIEIPPNDKSSDLTTGKARTRVIVRDLCGKFSWECVTVYGPLGCRAGSFPPGPSPDPCMFYAGSPKSCVTPEIPLRIPTSELEGPAGRFPVCVDDGTARESLNKMLRYIGSTSPECATQLPLTSPPRALNQQSSLAEADQINEILGFAEAEQEEVAKLRWSSSQRAQALMPPCDAETASQHNGTSSGNVGLQHGSLAPFQYSRLLLNQLNFLGWERRSTVALLQKNDKLLREVRYLDQQRSRETHKIAVIYVGAGQEDKNSILMNQSGSPEFENFVRGLGWDIDLRTHTGYRGGLDQNGSTGLTAPYFANSFIEVLFHVSTRIPAMEKEAMTKKLRHLGNDEVHVVWSEHQREYRRGIIATEFGDVFIVLYPMPDNLCRVQINAKPDVPFFGPLFDGAIVDQRILPALVRATAINADRAVNSLKMMFRNYYEVRSEIIENICSNFKEPTTFEEFACKVFAPSVLKLSKPSNKGVDIVDTAPPTFSLDVAAGKPRTGSATDSPSSPHAPPRFHRTPPVAQPTLQHSQSTV
ncbi:ral GTPase-activating protein subunit alpha-1 [Galendromus occidentalis]|uniref:Ral GTPase-activating protein subunit alpha-1 n=1 Tax=Galendromus occidentalis TaxID=34638 RepID=A0AAJ7SEU4_9ACAR|nr:ral GTPase-activating protein subunit alpha-1 [Galendromus occidentalis]